MNSLMRTTKLLSRPIINNISKLHVTVIRNTSKLVYPRLLDLQRHKEHLQEMDKYFQNRRSQFLEWNYPAERFAFCKRISEEIDEDLLIKALDANNFDEMFSLAGKKLVYEFCIKYLRCSWPILPEEGIQSCYNYLVMEESLARLASGIGMKDLIECEEYPPSSTTYTNCFYSIINAIKETSGTDRSEKFILDLIITQLVGKEMFDWWEVSDPYSILCKILENSNKSEPEPRLIGILGKNTIEAVFRIGIYLDKKLIGEGTEVNADLALKIAAYNTLNNFFKQEIGAKPLNLESVPDNINNFNRPNKTISQWRLNE